MPKKPDLAKEALLEQVAKLGSVHIGTVAKLVALLRDRSNRYFKGDIGLLLDRYSLVTMSLDAHPDDVARMLKWARAVEINGKQDRAKKEGAA